MSRLDLDALYAGLRERFPEADANDRALLVRAALRGLKVDAVAQQIGLVMAVPAGEPAPPPPPAANTAKPARPKSLNQARADARAEARRLHPTNPTARAEHVLQALGIPRPRGR